ncbi:MAG: ribonuclease P protein component [Arachnia propionica]|nr:MAG: ribonuclease P protein component [Arachnia propionica]
MLPASRRLRRAADFTTVFRRGARAGSASVVVHWCARADQNASSRVGFVVSKAVGNAVKRNRVKRRLRHLAMELIPAAGFDVVVRALPGAAESKSLRSDFAAACQRASAKALPC